MRFLITIEGRLPNLNDYTSATRTNRYKGAEMKRQAQSVVETYILEQWRGLKVHPKVVLHYRWYEQNGRRDIDNISGFGHKVIQDALVTCKIIPDDNQNVIAGYTDEFFIDSKHPRIEVEIEELVDMTVKQRIKKADDNEIFCIGSQTGFVFIGNKEEFKRDIGGINDECVKTLVSAKNNALRSKTKYMRDGGRTRICDRYGTRVDVSWQKCIDNLYQGLLRAERTYWKLKDYLLNYKPFENRKIKDEYKRVLDGATVLVVDGVECGAYWFDYEYKSKKGVQEDVVI